MQARSAFLLAFLLAVSGCPNTSDMPPAPDLATDATPLPDLVPDPPDFRTAACGAVFQPCCGLECAEGTRCMSDACTSSLRCVQVAAGCGEADGPCCGGAFCSDGLVCVGVAGVGLRCRACGM